MKEASIIVSCFNEIQLGFLESNLKTLAPNKNLEIICVDGGSTDGTLALVEQSGATLLQLPNSNRAQRYNLGIMTATSDLIVLLHPRSLISTDGLNELFDQDLTTDSWGAWTHSFDVSHPILRFTSWYSNCIRGDQRHIFYLDHCLFLTRSLARRLGTQVVPELEIFEDTELCLRLRRLAKPVRLKSKVTTSAVRFLKAGILRQSLRNQILKLEYFLGRNHLGMNRDYEKMLELNQKVPKKN